MKVFVSRYVEVLAAIVQEVKNDDGRFWVAFEDSTDEMLRDRYPEGFRIAFGGHEPKEGDAVIFGEIDGEPDVYLCPKAVFESKYVEKTPCAIDKVPEEPHPLIEFFAYEHLPTHLQEVSKPLGDLARKIDRDVSNSSEKTAGLRKLLEAKDCFIRAAL